MTIDDIYLDILTIAKAEIQIINAQQELLINHDDDTLNNVYSNVWKKADEEINNIAVKHEISSFENTENLFGVLCGKAVNYYDYSTKNYKAELK